MRTFLSCIVILLCPFCHAQTGDIGVSPVVLILTPENRFVKTEITNSRGYKSHFHGRLKSWRQVDGEDVYQEVTDWTISPTIFSIDPGRTQLIRLAPKNRQSLNEEQSFRLFLEEIPEQGRSRSGQIKMILRVTLPVFIGAKEQTNKKPIIKLGNDELVIQNPNNHHIALGTMSQNSKQIPLSGYVLPGQTRKIPNFKASGLSGWELTYGYLGEIHNLKLES